MIIMTVDHIEKSYGANLILEDFSFELQDRDKVGIVGRNGAGKTTLFKLMAGLEPIDKGAIHTKKNLRIGYLEQIPNFDETLNGRDVLNLAFLELLQMEEEIKEITEKLSKLETETEKEILSEENRAVEMRLHRLDDLQKRFELRGGYEMEQRFSKIVEGLKIRKDLLDQSFSALSGGEKTRLMLGKILLEEPELLLLDEPTNHLDLEALEWLENYLSTYNGAMLMISHDRAFLDKVATSILEVEEGSGRVWSGNYSQFKADKEFWLSQQIEIYKQQQKKVRAMEEAIRRFEDWGTRADNKAMFVKARNMEKRLEKMEKIDKPTTKQKQMGLHFQSDGRTGNQVFRLRNVSGGYGQKVLFSGVDLDLDYQDCAVLMGSNGVGKTTLFKLLSGNLEPLEGDVKVGSRVKLGILEQEVFFDRQQRTVLEYFNEETLIGEFVARGKLARFMFFSEDLSKKLNQLSGGERVRLRLCLMMEKGINVLLLDEPTNHMDIPSREILEMALGNFKGTILMISHDRYFIRQLAEKLLFLTPTGISLYEGDYEEWRSYEMEKNSNTKVEAKASKSTSSEVDKNWRNPQDRSRQNELRRAKQRLEVLEPLLLEKEEALKAVRLRLEGTTLSYEAVMELCEQEKELSTALADGEAEWLKLMEVCDES